MTNRSRLRISAGRALPVYQLDATRIMEYFPLLNSTCLPNHPSMSRSKNRLRGESDGGLTVVLISLLAPVTFLVGGLIFSVQPVLAGSLGFKEAFLLSLPLWLGWVVFGPLVVWLAFRFPLERGRLSECLPVHLLAFALICLVNNFAVAHAMKVAEPDARLFGMNPPPPGMAGAGVVPPRVPVAPNPPMAIHMIIDAFTYGILFSICQAVISSRQARERERRALVAESQLTMARLTALRTQLNPHFLFNALNGISTLVHTDPQAADDMIANLSELLRLSLDSTKEQEVPLRRELDFLQSYLDIEQRRYGDRLIIELEIAPDVLVAFVPTLLLQPLMENAIRHGLAPECRSVTIRLIARREGSQLQLAVIDDGGGYIEPATGRHDPPPGIGLANTRGRLRELYGNEQSLSIRSASINLEPIRGCIVEIQIPYHTEPLA